MNKYEGYSKSKFPYPVKFGKSNQAERNSEDN